MALSSESLYNIFKSGQVYSAPKKYTRVTYQPGSYDPLSLIKFPIGVWKPPSANYDDFVLKSAESFAPKGPIDRELVQLYGTKKRTYISNPSHTGYTPQDEPMTSYSPYHKMPQSLTRHAMQRVEEDNEYYSLKHKSWQKGYKNTEQKTNTWVSAADDAYTQQILKEYKISHGLAPADTEKGVLTEDVRLVKEEANNKKFMDRLRNMNISTEEYKRIMGVNPAQLGRRAGAQIALNEATQKYVDTQATFNSALASKGVHELAYTTSIEKYNKLQNELQALQAENEPTALTKYSTDFHLSEGNKMSDDDLIVDTSLRAAFLTRVEAIATGAAGLPFNANKVAGLIGFRFEDIKLLEYKKFYQEEVDKAILADPDQEVRDPSGFEVALEAAEVAATQESEDAVNVRFDTSVQLVSDLLPIIVAQGKKTLKKTTDKQVEVVAEDAKWRTSFANYTVAVDNIKSHPALLRQYDTDRISADNEHKSSVIDDTLFKRLEAARLDQKADDLRGLAASKKASDVVESKKRKAYRALISTAIQPFATQFEKAAKINEVRQSADIASLNTTMRSLHPPGHALAIDYAQQVMADELVRTNALLAATNTPAPTVKTKDSSKKTKPASGLNRSGKVKGAPATRVSSRRGSDVKIGAQSTSKDEVTDEENSDEVTE